MVYHAWHCALKTKSIFGRKTENLFSLLDALDNPQEEPIDENTTEDAAPVEERKVRVIDFENHKNRQVRKCPSLSASLEELPRQIIYDLDVGGLSAGSSINSS